MKRATDSFHWAGGFVAHGTEVPDDDPVAVEFPGYFEPVESEPAKKRPARPRGSRLNLGDS